MKTMKQRIEMPAPEAGAGTLEGKALRPLGLTGDEEQ